MDPLKGIRVASPCPASWERMAGDDRVRHCTQCDLNVYNFAEMTRDEVRDLLARSEGRLCARLYRRADGTLLTKDCPTGLRALRQRASRRAAAMFAAVVSASAFLTGCAASRTPRVKPSGSNVKLKVAAAPSLSVFEGTVRDTTGQALPGVTVVLCDEAGQHEITTATNENGAFSIQFPADGAYHIEVILEGFTPAVIDHLVLRQNQLTRAQVALHADLEPLTGVVVSASAPVVTHDILSTTYPQDFINKLPH